MDISMQGKVVVITGATSGIGLEAARILAGMGARVLAAGRSPERCETSRQSILASVPDAKIEYLVADLSAQRQVNALAEAITQKTPVIDVLVNNAGAVSKWFQSTEDGYEMTFAVNHLAPFLLTHRLMPLLQAVAEPRVLTVSSSSHYRTRMHWKDVMYRRGYFILSAYKQSKLANVLFAAELNRRCGPGGLKSFALHPGLVATEIGNKGTRGLERLAWEFQKRRGITPEQGAQTIVYLASQPGVSPEVGVYWDNCKPKRPNPVALDPEEAARLWALSEELCGLRQPPKPLER